MNEAKNEGYDEFTCARCGIVTTQFPALSRVDNESKVCSECGTEEAMQNYFKQPLTPLTFK